MKKKEFYLEIKNILLLEDEIINEETTFVIDSMSNLLLIAFFDENFNKTVSQEEIKKFEKIGDIIRVVGKENLK